MARTRNPRQEIKRHRLKLEDFDGVHEDVVRSGVKTFESADV